MKKFLLVTCFLFSLFSVDVHAQRLNLTKHFEGSSPTEKAFDNNGNTYISTLYTNTYTANGQFFLSNGSFDFLLSKYDHLGVHQWTQSIGSTSADYIESLTTDHQGNIYFTMSFNDSTIIDSTSIYEFPGYAGSTSILVKINAQGELQWTKTASINGPLSAWEAHEVSCDNQGNVIIGGFYAGSVSLDGTALPASSSLPFPDFLAKFDSLGNLDWVNTYQSGAIGFNPFSREIATDGNNNIYVVGNYFDYLEINGSIVGDTSGATTGIYYALAKYDAGGALLWLEGSPTGDSVLATDFDLCVSPTEEVYVAGMFEGTFNFAGTSVATGQGFENSFLLKHQSTGQPEWIKDFGPIDEVGIQDVAALSTGKVVITGWVHVGPIGPVTFSGPGSRAFVASFDELGTFRWIRASTAASASSELVGVDSQDAVYILGRYSSVTTMVIDNDTLPPPSGSIYNHFLAQFSTDGNVISGVVYVDKNNNGIKDSNDVDVPNIPIIASPNNNAGMLVSSSYYEIFVDTGTYQIQLPSPPPFYAVFPGSLQAAFGNLYGQIDSNNNFRLVPTPGITELEVSGSSRRQVRPNETVSNFDLHLKNNGTVETSDTLTLLLDTGYTFLSATPPPTTQSNNTLTWAYTDLQCLQSETISLQLRADTSLVVGDSLQSIVFIGPLQGDTVPGNNFDTINQEIIASYDPNVKEVLPAGPLTPQQIANETTLTYTIHFQNTGNDTAFRVIVRDTLSSHLQTGTIEAVASSHPFEFRMRDGENTAWIFENILLADSATNEAASKGYIRFKVKAKTDLIVGDSITNRAGIYFDFNAPIITDWAVTRIETTTAVAQQARQLLQLQVFPNPNQGNFTLQVQKQQAGTLEWSLYNLLGQPIQSAKMELSEGIHRLPIATNNQTEGIYFLRVITEGVPTTQRVVLTK